MYAAARAHVLSAAFEAAGDGAGAAEAAALRAMADAALLPPGALLLSHAFPGAAPLPDASMLTLRNAGCARMEKLLLRAT